MQKNLTLVCILAGVLSLIMSCGYRAAIDEEREMDEGKVFSMEQGDVQYNNGIRLRFREYGLIQRLDFSFMDTLRLDSIAILFRDRNCYLLHKGRHDFTDLGYCRTFGEFAVPISQYLLTGSYKCTPETIAGVNCDMLSCYNTTDHHRVASYYRVRMFEQEATKMNYYGGTFTPLFHNNAAITISEEVPDSVFELIYWDQPKWSSNQERIDWEYLVQDLRNYLDL